MRSLVICSLAAMAAVALLTLGGSGPATCAAGEAGDRMLAHDVFFSLKDNSPQAREKLVAACKKYLSDHPGTVWFSAGVLGEEFQRDVNDRDFDVALRLVFVNKAAHDKYATAEKHLKFIEENKESWKKVRVFDSYVAVSSHAEMKDRPRKAAADAPRKRPRPKDRE